MRARRRLSLVSNMLAGLAVTALGLTFPLAAQADVPTPKVTHMPAEKPGTPGRNYPFFATDIVLSNYGYVEEEFMYEGTANVYATANANTPDFLKTANVTTPNVPYRTRFLVRRPAQQSRFNGVVIVEWLNVTNQYDTDVLWLYQKEFFIREGYAWVGVSAQNAGLSNTETGLKVWSPSRYGTLDVTNGGAVMGDALSYDIYSQAGAAIRNNPRVLGGLRPTHVMAAGQSQSAGRLGTYINQVHPRDPVYDSLLLTVNNQAVRPDVSIPVVSVLSETERNDSRSQPDADKFRVWTVAGSTHSEQYSLLSRAAFLMRDLAREAVDACETPARSRVEIRYVYNAAVDALVKWKKNGTPAAKAPTLVFDEEAVRARAAAQAAAQAAQAAAAQAAASAPAAAEGQGGGGRAGRGGGRGAGGGAPGGGRGGGGRGGAPQIEVIKRDEHGNALGGIRTAEMEAPLANESGLLCGLGGTHVPFDSAKLNTLYPTHQAYVAKVTAASQALVKGGFMLQADATQTIEKAKRSIWGMKLTCGPLCADVRQFPSNPSSQLLANQTEFLVIKDADALVRIMDGVTKLIAEGYTLGDTPQGKKKFMDAAAAIQTYVDRTKQLAARGNMPAETEALLVKQATTLQDLVRKAGA